MRADFVNFSKKVIFVFRNKDLTSSINK